MHPGGEKIFKIPGHRGEILFDLAPIGICHLDHQGRILDTNQALQRMTRMSGPDLAGKNLGDLVHPAEAEDLEAMIRRLFKGQRERLVKECHLLRKDTHPFWSTLTVAARNDGTGSIDLIGFVEDINTRKAHEAALRQRAMHDEVTELPGRSLLYDRIGHAIRSSRRQQATFTILILDLHNFRSVNEAYGHHWGDLVLQQVGRRLMRRLRGSDTVARLRDDEFAAVLMGNDEGAGMRAASRLLQTLRKPYIALDGQRVELGASIGMAVFPEHGNDAELLIQRAKMALRTARGAGIGYAVFTPLEQTT